MSNAMGIQLLLLIGSKCLSHISPTALILNFDNKLKLGTYRLVRRNPEHAGAGRS